MRSPPQNYVICELSVVGSMGSMSEAAFMEYILEQLLTGQRQPTIRFTEEEQEAIEAEHIGEDVLRYPFLY